MMQAYEQLSPGYYDLFIADENHHSMFICYGSPSHRTPQRFGKRSKQHHLSTGFRMTSNDISGKSLVYEDRNATLRDICLKAFLGYPAGTGDNVSLFRMAKKIGENDTVDLKAEDVTLLKQRIDKAPFFVPQGAGQAIVMLDMAESREE